MRRKIVAGNWKMNTTVAEGVALAKEIAQNMNQVPADVQLVVAPPFVHLTSVGEAIKGSKIALSAQNCANQPKGAYTGEVAANMLAGIGCQFVILGHSERRQYYGETSATFSFMADSPVWEECASSTMIANRFPLVSSTSS